MKFLHHLKFIPFLAIFILFVILAIFVILLFLLFLPFFYFLNFPQKSFKSEKFTFYPFQSPPADYPFLQNLTDSLQKIQPTVQIIQEKEISDFAKSASRLEKEYLATQLSLISQELAFSSDFYFYSNPSTWSANVVLERLAANVFGERMILDFV